jgi:hypothetical protein
MILTNNLKSQAGAWYDKAVVQLAPQCLVGDGYDWSKLKPADHLCLFSFSDSAHLAETAWTGDKLLPFFKSVDYDLESILRYFQQLEADGEECAPKQ